MIRIGFSHYFSRTFSSKILSQKPYCEDFSAKTLLPIITLQLHPFPTPPGAAHGSVCCSAVFFMPISGFMEKILRLYFIKLYFTKRFSDCRLNQMSFSLLFILLFLNLGLQTSVFVLHFKSLTIMTFGEMYGFY